MKSPILTFFVVELANLHISAKFSYADEQPETFYIINFKLLKDHPGNKYRRESES